MFRSSYIRRTTSHLTAIALLTAALACGFPALVEVTEDSLIAVMLLGIAALVLLPLVLGRRSGKTSAPR